MSTRNIDYQEQKQKLNSMKTFNFVKYYTVVQPSTASFSIIYGYGLLYFIEKKLKKCCQNFSTIFLYVLINTNMEKFSNRFNLNCQK